MDFIGRRRQWVEGARNADDRQPSKVFLTMRSALMIGALLLAVATQPLAQGQSSPADAAAQALKLGQYEEVDKLLQNATDPRSVALRGRAAVSRGRYDEAEKLLARVATTAPTSDAALELGLLQLKLGRRPDAKRTLIRLADNLTPRSAAEYLRFGLTVLALTRVADNPPEMKAAFEDGKTALREADRLKPNDVDIQIALAELYAATTNEPGETANYFQNALKLEETNPAALSGFAHLLMEQNPPDARMAVERALKTNPNYEPAHLLAAEMALDDRRRPDAHTSIERALKVNPNSLEARSLDAAIAFLEGRTEDFDRKVKEILTLQPTYGEVYRIVGDHAARNYRFDEAAELVRKGLAIDANNTRAYADLGLHLLRTGDESNARQALERSWSKNEWDDRDTQSARPAGQARQVRGCAGWRHHDEVRVRGGGDHARAGAATGEGSARYAREAMGLQGDGTDPHRDVPEAR